MGIHTVALSGAHMETSMLGRTATVLTDLLAFERLADGSDSLRLRHPNTPWLMTVHEGGADGPPKASNNHYGVRVLTKEEVDAAHTYLHTHADEYGLSRIREPENQHGSYSVYFVEPGTNTLEIECYADVNRKESGIERLGGVRGPHWQTPLSPDRFPGRGYVPQALTHGTLAIADSAVSRRFYSEVLGLEVYDAYGQARVMYVKHSDTLHFIVCARREDRQLNPAAFRYTLSVPSSDDLADAHRWAHDNAAEYGIAEVHDVQAEGDTESFLIRDPDLNWWEIAVAEPAAR